MEHVSTTPDIAKTVNLREPITLAEHCVTKTVTNRSHNLGRWYIKTINSRGRWLGCLAIFRRITPNSFLGRLCQLADGNQFSATSNGEQTIQSVERTPTRLCSEVPGKLERS